MKIDTSHTSPHFTDLEIPVDFLVLHYTACNLSRTLEIFKGSERNVCSHFILDTDGTLYDLGGFYDGPIRRGAHAGKSHLEVDGSKYVNFNQFSIGVEIINLNGNILAYTEEQYSSLTKLTRHLQNRFSQLKNPERIVGHEHIAHWRGKADPGIMFDWKRFFTSLNLQPAEIHSFFACQDEDIQWLKSQGQIENWSKLSHELETRIAQRVVKGTSGGPTS